MDLPEYDLVIKAGTPFTRTYPVIQGKHDAPVPFTSITSARAHVRENHTSVAVLHAWDVEVVNIGGNAYIKISATAEETEDMLDWPTNRAQWDLEVTDSDGDPHMITGICSIRIKPRITQ